MTRRTIDEVPLRIWLEVLHLRKLIVDGAVHGCHFPRGAFWPLVIAGEILLDVTVRAGYSQSAAVTEVHDQKQSCRRSVGQNMNVLEHLCGGLLLVSCYLFGNLLNESVVDLLNGLSLGLRLNGRR